MDSVQCGAGGYTHNFEINCSKDNKRKTPLGIHVVDTIRKPLSHVGFYGVLYDNYLTSHKLLSQLAEKNIRGCGTGRDGRIVRCPLELSK